MPGTRKLGRPTASRMAMLRAMVTFLLEKGRIETTVTRAKEVRSMTEKMITIAKNPTLANKRLVFSFVTKESVAKKLFDEIAPRYAERNGGYTRIIKTGARRGDAAEMAIIELVKVKTEKSPEEAKADAKGKGKKGKAAKGAKKAAPAKEEKAAKPETAEVPAEEIQTPETAAEPVVEAASADETPAETAAE